ncbi:MAG TPA: amino acid adenylation domain-containing protein [Actinocrinis sp.]
MSAYPGPRRDTIVDTLRRRAGDTPDRLAFEFEESDDVVRAVDYAGLDHAARSVAALIKERGASGNRVLLLHPPGLDYVSAFLGCLYAGAVAVPIYPPGSLRGLERVAAIASDCAAELALSDSATVQALEGVGGGSGGDGRSALPEHIRLMASDGLDPASADGWLERRPRSEDLAFLQYTSGSTGRPKGVMLSHGNLVHNSAVLAQRLGLTEESRAVSWLPPYHDMGLIGGILQPLHAGFPCTLLSPLTFLHQPLRWLRALSRTHATITAAPDFAYAETARRASAEELELLDLSNLRHALVGAEPVRAATLDAFATALHPAGFRRTAFYPCYGLAEATLFVSGAADPQSGPSLLHAARAGLEEGRAVVAGPHDGPAAVLTGAGVASGEDEVVVVDPGSGREAPQGTVGEVWVAGPTVAQGYWRRPDETAEIFGARSPDRPDRVFLRTGDLGFVHVGELFIAGRIKDLIVLRGRNHHPQDIEQTAGAAHPLLQPSRAAVFALDDGTAERVILVHEVRRDFTADQGTAVTAAVRRAVATDHGLHLDEVVLVRLGAIPRTSSGKIRRAECRQRWLSGVISAIAAQNADDEHAQAEAAPSAAAALGAPATVIAAALDRDPDTMDPDLPLISQGLDSLRAVRLAAAVREAGGAPVELAALLSGMTPRDLAAAWGSAELRLPSSSAAALVPAVPPDRPTPLQEQIWLLDHMGAGGAYHISGGLRLTGPLDPELLERCLGRLVAAAPGLRTVFDTDAAGDLRRSTAPVAALTVMTADLSGLDDAGREAAALARMKEFAAAPFDLAAGPLVRFTLLRLAPGQWWLGLAAHHIVLDGWSLGVLLARLGELYRAGGDPAQALALPESVPPAPDAAEEAADAEFWQRYLDGARPTSLPTDRPPGPAPTWNGAATAVTVPAPLVGRLREFAAQHTATPFMVLITAFSALLGRWSGQDDLVVGTVVSGRDRPETIGAVGLLANTLPIRLDLGAAAATFAQAVDLARSRCLAAYEHARMPFDRIVRAAGRRSADSRAPLVRVLLALQDLPLTAWQAGDVRAEPFELPSPGAQFELALHLSPQPDGSLAGHAVYAADLFDAATIESLLAGLPVLLDAALEHPGTRVGELPVLSAAEADRIVRTAADGGPPVTAASLVHDLINAVAEARPDGVAVAWDGGSLTYRDLSEHAHALATRLRAAGAGPDLPVAVCLQRSADLVTAVYAVLLAGAAYLPLDPAQPPIRLARQVRGAGVAVLVGTEEDTAAVREVLGEAGGPVLLVEPQPGAGTDADTRIPATATAQPGGLANILHTSGSTGVPKAVMTTHAALANRLAWMQREYGLEPGEAVLHKTPVSFDVAGWELLWPLAAGATVVLARPDGHRDPYYLVGLIRRHRVTTCHFVPSMLQAFLEEPAVADCGDTLRRVICSGEELTPALAGRFRRMLPTTQLHNLYGPTEAAIDVTAQPVGDGHEHSTRIPIGRPIAGARLYVLDSASRVAPWQAPGELHVGGLAPARGYLGAPGLTADRFVPDPFEHGGRLYRTGDAARLLADGTLEYLGRVDRQLKIRGQRVEPAEIEAVLAAHPRIAAAAAEARPDPAGQPRLIAWAVARGPDQPTPGELRSYLARHLPGGMVPDVVTLLPELPLGPHGKLDRSALPDPDPAAAHTSGAEHIAPRTVVEHGIAEIWTDVLGGAQPSVTDDFFELGGHSLLATRIAVRVRAAFGADIPVGELLGGRLTIERLAALVQERQVAQADPADLEAALARISGLSDAEVASALAGIRSDV